MKLSEVKAGDKIYTDAAFSCMEADGHIVQQDDLGLFINCRQGKHYLDSQISSATSELIGISKEHF